MTISWQLYEDKFHTIQVSSYSLKTTTAGISDGNKKVSSRIWKWLSVCAVEIHREIDEYLVAPISN